MRPKQNKTDKQKSYLSYSQILKDGFQGYGAQQSIAEEGGEDALLICTCSPRVK